MKFVIAVLTASFSLGSALADDASPTPGETQTSKRHFACLWGEANRAWQLEISPEKMPQFLKGRCEEERNRSLVETRKSMGRKLAGAQLDTVANSVVDFAETYVIQTYKSKWANR